MMIRIECHSMRLFESHHHRSRFKEVEPSLVNSLQGITSKTVRPISLALAN